jgi:hypothetical protein
VNWQATHEFLRAAAILQQDVDVSQAFTNEFVVGSR